MYDLKDVLMELKKTYTIVVDKNEPTCVIWRVNLCTEDNAEAFVVEFTRMTNTNWIQYYQVANPKRMVFHKVWLCHRGSKNKATHRATERNSGCKAIIDIKIKFNTSNTRRCDEYLKLSPPLCAIVQFKNQHNHNIDQGFDLRLLRVSEETRSMFETYFESGLSASEAICMHESKLLLKDDSTTLLMNTAINPTRRQVQNIHDVWRSANSGTYIEPLKKIREKLQEYNKKKLIVSLKEEPPWCILIVTNIMRRTHTLTTSKDVIFCDSSIRSNLTDKSAVTFLMAPTNAGAIPIAILIHESQTEASYISAFSLLKSAYPKCFGVQEAPKIFITDDDLAEKNALKTTWPTSEQLLCHSRVGQAEWRWLNSNANIPQHRKQELMYIFKKVMLANEYKQRGSAVTHMQLLYAEFPEFVDRFKKFYCRSSEWTMLARKGKVGQKHNITHDSEATVGVIKDVVLCRSKTFNVAALVYFIVVVFEEYLQHHILSYAYNKRNPALLSFHNIPKKMKSIDADRVGKVDTYMYTVPSEKDYNCFIVDTEIGICSCPYGTEGHFCKHQAFLYNYFSWTFPNLPVASASARHKLGLLALGGRCPKFTFFLGSTENLPTGTDQSKDRDSDEKYNELNRMMEGHFEPEDPSDYYNGIDMVTNTTKTTKTTKTNKNRDSDEMYNEVNRMLERRFEPPDPSDYCNGIDMVTNTNNTTNTNNVDSSSEDDVNMTVDNDMTVDNAMTKDISSEYDANIRNKLTNLKPLFNNLPIDLKKKLASTLNSINAQEQFNNWVSAAIKQKRSKLRNKGDKEHVGGCSNQ